mgnify:CR=1 FL=1
MSPLEMAVHCRRQIDLVGLDAEVSFVVRTAWRDQKRLRLAGPGSPLGEPVGHANSGGTVVFFRATAVMQWLAGKLE